MPRYKHPSKYYADDKDIADLLLAENFSVKRILSLIRERGIFISPAHSKESLVDYLSQMPFSWPQLQALMEEVKSPDREEKITTCQAETSASLDQILECLDNVRGLREETFGESWSIHAAGDDKKVFVRISYSEMDNAQTRTLQRVQREIEVAIEKSTTGFEFRYPLMQRSENIIAKVIATLPPVEGAEKVKRTTIDLAGLVDPHHKTRFFILLMDGMTGFNRRDVLDLRMNRSSGDDSEGDDDPEKKETAEKIKTAVRKMTLAGESLLVTPEFRSLNDTGFFISRAVWHTRETKGLGTVYEIEAQFKNPHEGTGFCYLLKGLGVVNSENEVEILRKDISALNRKKINSAVEQAAYLAMAAVLREVEGAEAKAL